MIAVLEGLLFLVGDDGLNVDQISEILEVNQDVVLRLLNELQNVYSDDNRGLILKKFGNIYKLTTKDKYSFYYKKLTELTSVRNLSQSALETLAIIAYNEPITRVEIDELRGINSSQMIRNLIAKDLIKEVGKSDKVGHPILYGITDQFLDYFGLSSKEELPNISFDEISNDDIELYESKYKEE